MIGRRQVVAGIAAASLLPNVGRGQPADRLLRLAVLEAGAAEGPVGSVRMAAFKQTLRALGWEEGRNLSIVERWAGGRTGALSAAAEELLATAPHVILANTSAAVGAVLARTRTVPTVFTSVTDPVQQGFVASMAKPGGNLTGFTLYDTSIADKWLQLLREIAPGTRRVALLGNPGTGTYDIFWPSFAAGAKLQAVVAVPDRVPDVDGLVNALGMLRGDAGDAVVVIPDPFNTAHAEQIVRLTIAARVPALFASDVFPPLGGLICHSADRVDMYRRAASYVDRILRGEKPGDLPVQNPTAYRLIINARTARLLDLAVPPSLLARADEVIE